MHSGASWTRMTPNENFLKYFPDAEIPEEIDRSDRSPYLNIGTYVILHKLIQDCKLKEILDEYMDEKDTGFLEYPYYSRCCRNCNFICTFDTVL